MRRFLPVLLLALLVGCTPSNDPAAPDARALYAEDDLVIQSLSADDLPTVVQSTLSETGVELVLVNIWASWCAPCREEFPDLMRYDAEHPEVAVRFITVDFEDEVHHAVRFLDQMNYSGLSYLRAGDDRAFRDAVSPEWTAGGVPATVVFGGDGERLAFHEGKLDYDEIDALVQSARQRADAPEGLPIAS